MLNWLFIGRTRVLLGGVFGCVLIGCAPPEPAPLPEVPRVALVLKDGRLHRPAQAAPFTGTVIERYPSGLLQSRSVVSNGLLQGVSEGWHTNGMLQVREHFVAGKSHGVRTKFYANGTKLSEAQIANGQLNGTFRRWHENGVLAEQIELVDDQPNGLSLAYYPSGCLKVRARMAGGKVVQMESFKDGEVKSSPVVAAAEVEKPKS